MKIVTVIGARPQFIKAAPLSRELRKRHTEVLVHTGQHYDENMSAVFFRELGIPEPDHNLNIGSGSHGAQTGAMLAGIEKVLLKEKPDLLLVYGDTNSTVAGALAAVKLHIPLAHVEAGLRSYNRSMPEEINRVVTDHLSDWLFVPSESSRENLAREGITNGVHIVGDIMFDAVLLFTAKARKISPYPAALGIGDEEYYLCTVHRAENTDSPENLSHIFGILATLDRKVVFPVHPRTRKKIAEYGLTPSDNLVLAEPLGYLDMLKCLESAAVVLTDSGGIQKEAYYLKVPCVTLRRETEWVETAEVNWNAVTSLDERRIFEALDRYSRGMPLHPPLYGEGDTAAKIVTALERGW